MEAKYGLAPGVINNLNILPTNVPNTCPQSLSNGFFGSKTRRQCRCMSLSVDQFLRCIETVKETLTMAQDRTVDTINFD